MAKKIKDAAPPKGMDEAAIRSYRDKIKRAKTKADEARGTMGQLFKEFEDTGENKRALKEAMRLDALETMDAQRHLEDLGRYLRALGTFDQADLFESLLTGEQSAGSAPTTAMLEEAGRDGLKAGQSGDGAETCPYSDDDPRHAVWHDKYVEGQAAIAAGMAEPNLAADAAHGTA